MPADDIPGVGDVVVANPGAKRWLMPLAAALAEAGLLRRYVTPIAPTRRLDQLLARLPGPLRARAERELALRPLPAGISEDGYARAATVAELVNVGAARAGLPRRVSEAILRWRDRSFDRRASQEVSDADRVVVVESGAGLASIEAAAALGARTLLDYPICHHDFMQRMLRDEQRLRPDYAVTLQGLLPSRVLARLDTEVERADRIMVLTELTRRTFIEAGVDSAKITINPLGVDVGHYDEVERTRAEGPFRVLFAGQITQRKGISYLVDAFTRASLPNSELVLLGAVVGSSAPWRATPNVRHHPPVRYGELARQYVEADAYVLPSIVEGFPQTAIEAMAARLPVIVSENTFGQEVIDDGVNGFVVPIRDAEAIADRLRLLYEDPDLRARMGANARLRAQDFSWDRFGNRLIQIITELRA
jgi:glycosyltransferase involved in cell wall biosynthesis